MIGFIRHNTVDQVGVAVTDVKKGESVEGWTMEDDSTLTLTAPRTFHSATRSPSTPGKREKRSSSTA